MPKNIRLSHILVMVLLHILCLPTASKALETSWVLESKALQEQIQRLLIETDACRPVSLEAAGPLATFYAERDFTAAWVDAAGLKPSAQAFLVALRNAHKEGLDPGDYPLGAMENELAELFYQAGSPEGISTVQAAALDIGFSQTALRFGHDLALGRISPEKTGQSWFGPRHSEHWQPRLDRMVTATTADAIAATAAPAQPGYADLRRALERYRTIAAAGGWSPIPQERILKQGMRTGAIIQLRYRLEKSGDLHPEINRIAANSMTLNQFDTAVARAVTAFQTRHGLKPDGKVGKQTLSALNVPVEARINTLLANMERRRWAPRDLGTHYLRVNIPAFELEAVSAGQVVKTMRVVVGRPKRPTPVLSGQMTYLELNPYWHVPPSIARKDILPKVLGDLDYLFQQGFRVFSD